jgi:hypothetical protein
MPTIKYLSYRNKLHLPTNEAPHWDSATGLAVETLEGKSLARMLYDALRQSVHVMLVGSDVGGLWAIFSALSRVSGPLTVSMLVRVSVIHKVFPLIIQVVSVSPWIDIVPDILFKTQNLADRRIQRLDCWN